MWGRTFRRINNRSLSLRPFGLFAILTDRTGWSLAPATPTMAFYVPARRHQVTPVPVGYATAPNQELRRRDFHPLVQQPDSLHACMVAEPPNGGPSTRSASNHVVTSMIRRGRYQPERQVLSGIRTRRENAPFHGALMISGYPSRLYDEHLCDWRSLSLQVNNHAAVVTESIWFNFAPDRVHWARFAGRNFTHRQTVKRKAENWARRYAAMPPGERLAVLAAVMTVEDGSWRR